jgi:GGDEF domain-containing protein/tetratricopeptide (TPR) repeat protein
MAVLNKHLEKAERLIHKGKLEDGLEELLLARKELPSDDSILLDIADTYQKLNRLRECRQCYGFLFDKYVEKNEPAKALEYFGKLQKLGPPEPRRLLARASLVVKDKPQEAAENYKAAMEAAGAQDPETALQCLEGLSGLQPSVLEWQRRLAELASKLGKTTIAVLAYNKMGELLTAEKKYPEAAYAFEGAYGLSGENASARLALAKACSRAKRYGRILELYGPEAEQSADRQVLELLGETCLAERQFSRAEAVYWKLAAITPDAYLPLIQITAEFLRESNFAVVLPMIKRLEEQLTAAKAERELSAMAEQLSQVEHNNIAICEIVSRLSDQQHLDGPLSRSLERLFELYFETAEFSKATTVLERLIDVDPYSPDNAARLRRLEGKTDASTWRELSARLGLTAKSGKAGSASASAPSANAEPGAESDGSAEPPGSNTLGDLILQAEIFLQYQLNDKARERIERIAKLFPGEEEKNEDLRSLYERAGFSPAASRPQSKSGSARSPEVLADWASISEIIRSLSRQSSVKGVLSTAVNGIGRMWQASRCVVGLAVPKQPPTMVLEYIAPTMKASDGSVLGKLVMGLQQILVERNSPLVAENISKERQLAPLKTQLATLQVESLVAVLLREDDQPAGILVLEQCNGERSWKQEEVAGLETLAGQIILAASNARLRSLMKTLAVTDEHSGLLHRDSYLTCLLSEVERMRTQKTPLVAAILDFSPLSGDSSGLEQFVRQFSTTFASHLRQSDIALKYGPHSLAVILPATTGDQAVFFVDKMRRLSTFASPPGGEGVPSMAAGVAEAVQDAGMDGVDIVTELINRAEWALEEAQTKGRNFTKLLAPPTLPH